MPDNAKPLILVIDDRQDMFAYCERFLGDHFTFRYASGGRAAKALLAAQPIAAALVDRDFSQAPADQLLGPREDVRNEGFAILRWLRTEHPDLPAMMVTGHRDAPTAEAAADLGADFLAWEDVAADPAVLRARLRRALDLRQVHNGTAVTAFRRLGLVAESTAFTRVLGNLYQALPGRAPILLLGPTGSGKDTLARAAHRLAGDPARPYVEVNIAALNANLIESELFGHAKGAYTDAKTATIGKLRAAHGGTLFLNEIGDLPSEIQAKLLTALERAEITPVGDVHSYPADFRLITATSRDLRQLVETGMFRRDLLYRIAGHTIEVPPLCERVADIPAMANAFLLASPAGRSGDVVGFAREAMECLTKLPWHGNVRELQRIVEVACANARHTVTTLDVCDAVRRLSFFAPPPDPTAAAAPAAASAVDPAQRRLEAEDSVFRGLDYDQLTRAYFFYLTRASGGQMIEAARLADISKSTIYKWRERYVDGRKDQREMEGEA
ncbi:MAG: sigma-54-dependent Fis family transcriptional regulator [bacterium]|nr:sigma-54-dependent Fis family transcriptional regulator [bacterium]